MSRTEKLRRLARQLQVENGRLNKLADAFRDLNLTLTAREVNVCATKMGILSLSLNHIADTTRDRRGASTSNSAHTGDYK